MLNEFEQQLFNELITRDYPHEYVMQQLDINSDDVLYSEHYNPTSDERYKIVKCINGYRLIDTRIRNSFYGCILRSSCKDTLEKEKQRLLEPQQLSLF